MRRVRPAGTWIRAVSDGSRRPRCAKIDDRPCARRLVAVALVLVIARGAAWTVQSASCSSDLDEAARRAQRSASRSRAAAVRSTRSHEPALRRARPDGAAVTPRPPRSMPSRTSAGSPTSPRGCAGSSTLADRGRRRDLTDSPVASVTLGGPLIKVAAFAHGVRHALRRGTADADHATRAQGAAAAAQNASTPPRQQDPRDGSHDRQRRWGSR